MEDNSTLYFKIFDCAPDAIIVVDDDGKIAFSNHRTTKLFGYNSGELQDQPIEMLLPDRLTKPHEKQRKSYTKNPSVRPMGASKELVAKTKDGSEFFVEISLSPIRNKDKLYISAFIRDVTEKINTNNKLKDLLEMVEQKNRELEHFAYTASHDLQEPLRTIKGILSLFTSQYLENLDKEASQYIEFINGAVSRMSALIKGLLDYSRIGQGDISLHPVDCNALIGNVLDDLAVRIEETNAKICLDMLPVVNGMETELRLLFQNLISNAIKFSKKDEAPLIRISAEQQGDYWKFAISDNGIGIPEEHLEQIFIIFKRLNDRSSYEGAGIGLAHCKKIIDLHQGKIWVTSKLNEGSTFHFTLPVVP